MRAPHLDLPLGLGGGAQGRLHQRAPPRPHHHHHRHLPLLRVRIRHLSDPTDHNTPPHNFSGTIQRPAQTARKTLKLRAALQSDSASATHRPCMPNTRMNERFANGHDMTDSVG
eukprot:2263492-Pyramimonas_sp.AAC.1